MSTPIHDMLKDVRVIPVLAFESVEEALQISHTLVDAKITTLEITLRHASAWEAIKAVKQELGDKALVGVGTITKPEQVEQAMALDVDFGVSPGLTDIIADAVNQASLPFLPGISTISEAIAARDHGFSFLKCFPASVIGGPSFLKAVGSVLPELTFCPTGGVTPDNMSDYLALKNIHCVGMSALTPRDKSGQIDPATVTAQAETVLSVAGNF